MCVSAARRSCRFVIITIGSGQWRRANTLVDAGGEGGIRLTPLASKEDPPLVQMLLAAVWLLFSSPECTFIIIVFGCFNAHL